MFTTSYSERFGLRFPTFSGVPAVSAEAFRFFFATAGTEVELIRDFDGSFSVVVLHADDGTFYRETAFAVRREAEAFAVVALQEVANARGVNSVGPDTTSLGGRRLQDDMNALVAGDRTALDLFLGFFNGRSDLLGPFVLTADRARDEGKVPVVPPRYFSTLGAAVENLAYMRRDHDDVFFSVTSLGFQGAGGARRVRDEELLAAATAVATMKTEDAGAVELFIETMTAEPEPNEE